MGTKMQRLEVVIEDGTLNSSGISPFDPHAILVRVHVHVGPYPSESINPTQVIKRKTLKHDSKRTREGVGIHTITNETSVVAVQY